MNDADSDLRKLARSWIRYQGTSRQSDEWAVTALWELVRSDYERSWQAVRLLCDLASTTQELCNIGAGPIEDLIEQRSAESLDRLEQLVHENARSLEAAACVWTSDPIGRQRIDQLLRRHNQGRL